MNNQAEDLLVRRSAAWGFTLSATQLEQFALYAAELVRWNEQTNLTAITDRQAIYVRHFLDSLLLARYWGPQPHSLIDLGSGAGFPGLPLKILCPELELLLVESVGKKTAFLHHLIAQLRLTGVRALTTRAETIGRDPNERERYTVVTARAVADLRVLAEYGLPLLQLGGRLLAPKGSTAHAEAAAAATALTALGGELLTIHPVELPGVEPRALVVIGKVAPTSMRYPRPVGVPSRRPL